MTAELGPRHTLHVEADREGLAEVIAELEARGFKVECAALYGWERLRERDELLREAHGLMSGTPWGRCVQLEAEIRRFEAIQWPRLRDRETSPEGCSALRRHLFEARRLGPLPSTARQLWNVVVKRSGRGDFKEKPLYCAPRPA